MAVLRRSRGVRALVLAGGVGGGLASWLAFGLGAGWRLGADGVGGFAGGFGGLGCGGEVGREFGEACAAREAGVGFDRALACGADALEVLDR